MTLYAAAGTGKMGIRLFILPCVLILVGCSDGHPADHEGDFTYSGPSDINMVSRPLPYDDVVIAGNLSRVDYEQLSQTVLDHRPFKPPDGSKGWYTAAIFRLVVTDDSSKVYAQTSFTGRQPTSGNVVILKRKPGGWKVVDVDTWVR